MKISNLIEYHPSKPIVMEKIRSGGKECRIMFCMRPVMDLNEIHMMYIGYMYYLLKKYENVHFDIILFDLITTELDNRHISDLEKSSLYEHRATENAKLINRLLPLNHRKTFHLESKLPIMSSTYSLYDMFRGLTLSDLSRSRNAEDSLIELFENVFEIIYLKRLKCDVVIGGPNEKPIWEWAQKIINKDIGLIILPQVPGLTNSAIKLNDPGNESILTTDDIKNISAKLKNANPESIDFRKNVLIPLISKTIIDMDITNDLTLGYQFLNEYIKKIKKERL